MAGYVIAQINLKNKEGYKEYVDKVPAIIKNFGGEYLVKAGEFKSIVGSLMPAAARALLAKTTISTSEEISFEPINSTPA